MKLTKHLGNLASKVAELWSYGYSRMIANLLLAAGGFWLLTLIPALKIHVYGGLLGGLALSVATLIAMIVASQPWAAVTELFAATAKPIQEQAWPMKLLGAIFSYIIPLGAVALVAWLWPALYGPARWMPLCVSAMVFPVAAFLVAYPPVVGDHHVFKECPIH